MILTEVHRSNFAWKADGDEPQINCRCSDKENVLDVVEVAGYLGILIVTQNLWFCSRTFTQVEHSVFQRSCFIMRMLLNTGSLCKVHIAVECPSVIKMVSKGNRRTDNTLNSTMSICSGAYVLIWTLVMRSCLHSLQLKSS